MCFELRPLEKHDVYFIMWWPYQAMHEVETWYEYSLGLNPYMGEIFASPLYFFWL